MSDDRRWGWCQWCETAFALSDNVRIPYHCTYEGDPPCPGSERVPRELVTDDNERIPNPDFRED